MRIGESLGAGHTLGLQSFHVSLEREAAVRMRRLQPFLHAAHQAVGLCLMGLVDLTLVRAVECVERSDDSRDGEKEPYPPYQADSGTDQAYDGAGRGNP